MPRAFDITPSTTASTAKPGGTAEFSFTVSNKLGKPIRARALAEPDGPTPRGWLSVVEAERDFTHDGTQTFIAKVAVPAGTKSGAYGLHLLVSSVSNPDEDYAHGPAVTVAVAEDGPPPRPFPWWIVAVAAGVVVIGLGSWLLYRSLKSGGLGDECELGKPGCQGELLCAPAPKPGAVPSSTLGQCLAGPQGKCKEDAHCTTQRCQAGLCAFPEPGATCPSPPATCPPNQACVELDSGKKACLLKAGEPCQSHIHCASEWCREGKNTCGRTDQGCDSNEECREPFVCHEKRCALAVGQRCTVDSDCITGFCDTAIGTPVCKAAPSCTPPCGPLSICIRGQCRGRIIIEAKPFRFRHLFLPQ